MKTRSQKTSPGEKAITIEPIALCMIQYFDLKDMYAYSLINTSTSKIIHHFTQSKKIKKHIELSKKLNQSLQNDAKKMLSYSLKAKTIEETKNIEAMLKKIADGEMDQKILDDIKNRQWDYKSSTQEVCQEVTSFTSGTANSYLKHLSEREESKESKVKESDIYVLLFLYGISGISYLANLAVGVFNSYFNKPPEAQFKNRLDYMARNLDKDPDEDNDNNNKNPQGLSK